MDCLKCGAYAEFLQGYCARCVILSMLERDARKTDPPPAPELNACTCEHRGSKVCSYCEDLYQSHQELEPQPQIDRIDPDTHNRIDTIQEEI